MVICAQYYYHPMVFGWFFPFRFFFFMCVCGPFLKSLLNLLQYYFCFMFWFIGQEACGILVPWLGIEPAHPALEGKALTTGPPEKPLPNVCLRSQVCREWSRLPKVTQLHVLGLGLHPRWEGREGSGSWVVSGPIAEGQLPRRGKCSMWGVEKESSYRRDKW